MDDVDLWVVQDRSIIRVLTGGFTMPFLDQVRGPLGAISVGIANGNVVPEFSDVGSRSPRSVDTCSFLTRGMALVFMLYGSGIVQGDCLRGNCSSWNRPGCAIAFMTESLYDAVEPCCTEVDSSETKRVATEAIIRHTPPKTTT